VQAAHRPAAPGLSSIFFFCGFNLHREARVSGKTRHMQYVVRKWQQDTEIRAETVMAAAVVAVVVEV